MNFLITSPIAFFSMIINKTLVNKILTKKTSALDNGDDDGAWKNKMSLKF